MGRARFLCGIFPLFIAYIICGSGIAWGQYDPPDDGGYIYDVGLEIDGNMIHLHGIVVNPDGSYSVPDWRDLIEYNSPCAQLEIIGSGNCHNPGYPGGPRALYFWFDLLVIFEDGSDCDFAIWLEGDKKIHRIPSDKNYYPTKVEIRDVCGNAIRSRPQPNNCLDQDEEFMLYAEIKSRDPLFKFPYDLQGICRIGELEEYISLYRIEEGEGFAYYLSDACRVSIILGGALANDANFTFKLDYRNSPVYGFMVRNIKFTLGRLIFDDNIKLSGYGPNVLCYPWSSYLTFGSKIEIDEDDRPFNCDLLPAAVVNDPEMYDIFSDGTVAPDSFFTATCQTSYQTMPLFDVDNLELHLKLSVAGGPKRDLVNGYKPLTIYSGFQADDIWLSGPGVSQAPDGVTVVQWNAQGVTAHASTNPPLASQARVHYYWLVVPGPDINGSANCVSPDNSDTTIFANFMPGAPGQVQLSCHIWDESGTDAHLGPITIRIAPEITIDPLPNDNKVCFNDASPGILTIGPCHATTGNERLDELIEWDMTQIGGSILTTNPSPPVGPEVTFTFTGLPQNNDEFGEKVITATLDNYNLQYTLTARIYYPKTIRNNPDGMVPNWFYYWKQNEADEGPVWYGQDAFPICQESDIMGDYVPSTRIFFICDIASDRDVLNQCLGSPELTGVDVFEEICKHENNHLQNWIDWYLPRGPFGDPPPLFDPEDDDLDGDDVPDVLEPLFGFDPQNPNSDYPADEFDDFEELAYAAACLWPVGSVDDEDWSNPGHQY
jgi:hypothetical protein